MGKREGKVSDPSSTRDVPSGVSVTAVIVDIVKSRVLTADARRQLQAAVLDAMARWNRDYGAGILVPFAMTLGDEFEGLLSAPEIIPDVMWELERSAADVRFRWGIGFGEIHTAVQSAVAAVDGPAFHRAREAIAEARKESKHGGVYAGFGDADCLTLNGLSRLLARQRLRFSNEQREAIDRLRSGNSQTDAAAQLDVSKQALSQRLKSAGWPAYAEGDAALRAVLATYNAQKRLGADASLADATITAASVRREHASAIVETR